MDDIMKADRNQWVYIGDAARQIGVDHSTLVKMCNAGKVDHMRVGAKGHRRILATEIPRLKRESRFARLNHDRIDSVDEDLDEAYAPLTITVDPVEPEQDFLFNPFGQR